MKINFDVFFLYFTACKVIFHFSKYLENLSVYCALSFNAAK